MSTSYQADSCGRRRRCIEVLRKLAGAGPEGLVLAPVSCVTSLEFEAHTRQRQSLLAGLARRRFRGV